MFSGTSGGPPAGANGHLIPSLPNRPASGVKNNSGGTHRKNSRSYGGPTTKAPPSGDKINHASVH